MKLLRVLRYPVLITLLFSCHAKQDSKSNQTQVTSPALNQAVLGQDEREITATIPYRIRNYPDKVGQLITKSNVNVGNIQMRTCTAALIKNSFIITAAQCAYDESGKKLVNQHFYPGIDRANTAPFDKFRVKRVFHPADYQKAVPHPEKDIAIMELERNDLGETAGESVGTFGFWGKIDFQDGNALTIGYPISKGTSNQFFEEDCMVKGNQYNERLEVGCDVTKGQAGSPLLFYSRQYDTHHVQGVINSVSNRLNYGARISSKRGQIIKYIVAGSFKNSQYQKEGFQEDWISFKTPSLSKIYVSVKNRCKNKDLYVAINSVQDSGKWKTQGYYTLSPYEERTLFETKNSVFYIRAARKGGTVHTDNDLRKYLSTQGENIKLQRYEVDDWGNYTYRFGCY